MAGLGYGEEEGKTVILPEYLHIEAIIQQNGSRRIEFKRENGERA